MKVCFTGGGTGGHVFPAFAVDTQLQLLLAEEGTVYSRFWIGSKKGEERAWVESAGITHYGIQSGKLRRYLSWRFFPDMVGVCIGFFQALLILYRERPDVMFSKGGYVSVPPIIAAKVLRIPSITHESDALPGLATKLNARFVKVICIPFSTASHSFSMRLQHKLVVTGVPSRLSRKEAQGERSYQRFNIRVGRKVIVVLGGSQGAAQLNRWIWENLDSFLALGDIVHQTGAGKFRKIEQKGYHAVPFITEGLDDLLGIAALVISRSGATAIADFLEMGVPMVLVPLGLQASRGDQLENARRLASKGAAIVVHTSAELVHMVEKVLTDDALRLGMIQQALPLRIEGVARRIAQVVLTVTAKSDKRSN